MLAVHGYLVITPPGVPPHLCLCAAWLPQGMPPPESWDELSDGRALLSNPNHNHNPDPNPNPNSNPSSNQS